jgi:surface protein
MFTRQPLFNQDVGTKVVTVNGVTYTAWNVENVTNMSFMFNSFLGTADSFGVFNNGGSDSIKNWNTSKVITLVAFCQRQAFFNQDVGTKVVTVGSVTYTAWDIANVTSLSNAFSCSSTVQAGAFNNGGSDSIKHWNTSKVTTMTSLFNCQQSFDQPIGTRVSTINGVTYTAWDTLNVTNMSGMLNAYTTANTLSGVFNNGGSSAIGNWNTSKVTTFNGLFQNQPSFNRGINTSVVTINGVTYTAWDTLNVTNMSNVFGTYRNTGIFNQSIDNWNTSKVTTMNSMFRGQILYDKGVGTKQVTVGASTYTAWDTLNVTDMAGMFNANLLNSDAQGVFNNATFATIRQWNTSKVTSFFSMFKNQPLFNQNLRTASVTVGASTYTAWNTLEATNMAYMFFNKTGNATSQFNQNIGNWNTAKVTDMTAMFYNAAAFNQNLNSWNVSLVTAFNSPTVLNETFADGIGLSTANYDNLLEGWSLRPVLADKVISFGTTKYSAAAVSERAILTSAPNNWTIIDGGQL